MAADPTSPTSDGQQTLQQLESEAPPSPRQREACSPRKWPGTRKGGRVSDARQLSCSPSGRSEETIRTLRAVRLGYTSPKLRAEAAACHRAHQSFVDAAWDGDVAGLAALIEREEGAVDLDKLDYLQRYREGLRLDLDPKKRYQMKGFQLHRVPDYGRSKYAPFCATPLMYAVANLQLQAAQWLIAKEAKTTVSAELVEQPGLIAGASVLDVAFANTWWASGPRAIRQARAVKKLVLERAPASKATKLNGEGMVLWLESRGVMNCDPLTRRRWTPQQLVDRHLLDGQRAIEWLAQDWRDAGFDTLRELQKLFYELFMLLRGGFAAGVKKKADGQGDEAEAEAEKKSGDE
eukprot:TRINITY_DN3579_c0_g1_i2.p1 TRINITY_DN3579_c0_g1~~TRINITY_DN3579_c0_g1_i2.p1  ORF type:complete len:368 (+),score=93.29 TRINITY_DN3579_c0_g1_i2:60-1106(+)